MWGEGRVDAVFALVHPDLEWLEPAETPDRTIAHGREAALAAVETWMATWSSYENELRETREVGDRVLLDFRQRMTGAGSNLPVESDLFQVWTVRDGLAVRMAMFTSREEALAELG
jgi:ketosteroid isomerase-like protein